MKKITTATSKFLATFLTTTIILAATATTPLATAATFSDVPSSNDNYDAITYLESVGILEGYSDGTFRPDTEVNRAEFLKIIIEGSEIATNNATNNTSLPFSDVPTSGWYTPYVQKAYEEGWIVGYEDNTFRPAQTITKAEALKILGEAQQWETSTHITEQPFDDVYKTAWFTPYIAFAKDNGYLEETSNNYEPNSLMTRAKISETIYRTLVPEDESDDQSTTNDNNDNTNNNDDATTDTSSYSEISTTFFDNITLSESLPNIFYKNEVYTISGNLTASNDNATIIIEGKNNSIFESFTEETNGHYFEIPVHFRESGEYLIGIIPGEDGNSKAAEITVESSLPTATSTEEPTEEITKFSIEYGDDTTYIKTTAPSSTLKKIIFEQGTKEETYISRQNTSTIPIQYKDFKNFDEEETEYHIEYAELSSISPLQISSGFESTETEEFEATLHEFNTIEDDLITTSPKDSQSSKTISFSGTTNTEIRTLAYIIKPNGFVKTVELDTSGSKDDYYGTETLLSNGTFSFSYTGSSNGTYIVEINSAEGIPIVNHPIYIGSDLIPLVPSYFDLHERSLFTENLSVSSARSELLELINDSRQDHGLSTVKQNTELNSLAQAHAQDMADNGYFAHVNLDGKTPDERRIAAGILTPTSENIAKDVSVEFAHWGLMRSAAHRTNILENDWERVGLGIVEDNGYLYIVEEFTSDELSDNDLQDMEDELEDEINDYREDNGKDSLTRKYELNQAAKYMNNENIDEDAELTQSLLSEAIAEYSVSGAVSALLRNHSIWQDIIESYLDDSTLLEEIWSRIGIDVQIDQAGNIQAIIILNQP